MEFCIIESSRAQYTIFSWHTNFFCVSCQEIVAKMQKEDVILWLRYRKYSCLSCLPEPDRYLSKIMSVCLIELRTWQALRKGTQTSFLPPRLSRDFKREWRNTTRRFERLFFAIVETGKGLSQNAISEGYSSLTITNSVEIQLQVVFYWVVTYK